MGVSLTEQGYEGLDYDLSNLIKHIGIEESKWQEFKNTMNTGKSISKR